MNSKWKSVFEVQQLARANEKKKSSSLQPPTFSLKTLLVLVSIAAATMAVISSMNQILASLFLLTAAMILLHVAGNALGTRLRDGAGSQNDRSLSEKVAEPVRESIEPTTLSRKKSLGVPLVIATAIGAIAAGGGGYYGLVGFYGGSLEPGALSLGVIALAALGGFWGFWLWSLLHVAVGAWWQAHSTSRR